MKLTAVGRNLCRCHDEIAFVFAIGIIGDDDHSPSADVGNGIRDGVKMHTHQIIIELKKKYMTRRSFLTRPLSAT